MIEKDYDIAMTYENLTRAVFDCDRFEGPYQCAEASVYHSAFVPTPNRLGRLILKCLLDSILKNGNYSEEDTNILLDIWGRLINMKDQDEAIIAIEEIVDFLNERGH